MWTRGFLTAIAVSLIAPAAAVADRGDFEVDLGTGAPGAGTTAVKFHVVYRHPDDPNAKPPPITGAEFRLPSGTRINDDALPQCKASSDELRARGTSACPPESRVGGGTLTAITGFGPPADPVEGDVHAFNGDNELIEVVTATGTDRVLGMDRLTIEGSTLTAHPPSTPGGPPDGKTSVKEIRLTVDRPGWATTPASCPAAGWTYGASFAFADGGTHAESAVLPCTQARVGAPRLSFASQPERARVGKPTRFKFRVRATNRRCISGAKVRFAGKRERTNSRGRVTIATTLKRAGAYRLSASHRGCRAARGSVAAVR